MTYFLLPGRGGREHPCSSAPQVEGPFPAFRNPGKRNRRYSFGADSPCVSLLTTRGRVSVMQLTMIRKFSIPAALALSLTSVSAHAAAFYTFDIPTLTTNLTTWSDGSAYTSLFPAAPATGTSTLTANLGGVPFALSTDSSGNDAFYYSGSGANSLTISTNVSGAATVYTLINTAYGSAGANVGQVTFNATNGLSYTAQLIEGGNVRDHYWGNYVNTTTDPTTTQAVFGVNSPGHAHLDMQAFALPSSFQGETLTSIVFTSNGLGGKGQPFIAGATVAVVPEPATYGLMLSGLGLVGLALRRKKHSSI